ncbi:MAG: peptidoglycan-binding protein [Clostridiales bacterium]|nr:peptidoglycan-binding protein [Clostridiales bacterium]
MKKYLALLLALAFLAVGAAYAFAEKAPIQNGDEGDMVARLQIRLFELGYYTFKPTGFYGTVTQKAMQQFQQSQNLPETGTGDGETLAALFADTTAPAPFRATVPLTFTGGGSVSPIAGAVVPWSEAKALFQAGEAYAVTHCASGAVCRLVFESAGGHAHMRPETEGDAKTLNAWLGTTNSFYKCAVTVMLGDRPTAASLQWSGETCCVYFAGSVSDVLGLPDAEHDMLIQTQVS